MFRKLMWVLMASMLASILMVSGCSRDESPLEPDDQIAVEEPGESPEALFSYPPYSFVLNLPFLKQVPPGDWAGTKNCGQTCVVMLAGYFNGTLALPSQITAQNTWLAEHLNDPRYNQANGWYTGLGLLQTLLSEKHDLSSSIRSGNHADDVVNYASQGKPCIVGVMIKNGKLVSSGGVAHWALVVGWDGQIVMHDPGTSTGSFKKYSVAAFEASWATQGKSYMPVWK